MNVKKVFLKNKNYVETLPRLGLRNAEKQGVCERKEKSTLQTVHNQLDSYFMVLHLNIVVGMKV